MYNCAVCEKTYKTTNRLVLPKCCQSNSEAKYLLCINCVKKCEKCPFCRSQKQHCVISASLAWEMEHLVYLHYLYRTTVECIAYFVGCTLYKNPYEDPKITQGKSFEEIVEKTCKDELMKNMALKIFTSMGSSLDNASQLPPPPP